jgi:predicted transcriptional regulator
MIGLDNILDLESRKAIYEFIKARPGTYMREMERGLGMQMGMLTYHLHVLVEAGLIRTETEGNHLRYFPAEDFPLSDRKALSFLRNRSTRAILMHILDRGTVSFEDLRSLLGVSKSTLSYHLKRLSDAGLVVIRRSPSTMVSPTDPGRLADMLVWVGGDVSRDPADELIEVWNRLRER